MGYSPPDINFALNVDVVKGLLAEPLFPQRASTPGDRTRGRTLGEDAVDARLAHFVVAFRVDEEAHVGVEIARRFAYGADI